MEGFEDKVALITGGASGIGRATAFALAERGAVVVVGDVDEEGGRAVAEKLGGRFVALDVSDLESNLAAVEHCRVEAGGLDVAFLNAGVTSGCGVGEDFDLERYRRAMSINLDGVVYGAHAASEAMRKAGTGGEIVATASLAGLMGMALDPIYGANKHAVVGLVRALGPALAPVGINVNAVCPGFADTAILDGNQESLLAAGFPIMKPEEVASVVIELLEAGVSGECWFVQLNRHGAFRFNNIPGPRPEPAA